MARKKEFDEMTLITEESTINEPQNMARSVRRHLRKFLRLAANQGAACNRLLRNIMLRHLGYAEPHHVLGLPRLPLAQKWSTADGPVRRSKKERSCLPARRCRSKREQFN